ncbi:MAG: ATP-dependent helicase HrpB [Mariprofundaceae bacterium]|nr:ATP-dependent helicase HrpB [Mariprofundaceae bacterium]
MLNSITMPILPIHDVLRDIKDTLTTHNRLVLQAPPGAGKTTAVPIALLGQNWLGHKQIIMLEPRRIAARNAAARMAFLLGEKVGDTVGYQIRQDNCFSDKTKILVVTEGILTRKIQADPELEHTALVIFDEFHERSLHADLSLALCLQSQQILRDDLKILVMSATLNTDAVATLLDHAPIIQSEGRSFPVENRYLDNVIRQHNINPQQQLMISLTNTVKTFIHEHQGNCLVFLPGVKEINQLSRSIKQHLDSQSIHNMVIAPLHGSLSKQQQDLAIAAPTDKTKRKIVLATNIAETSITIEGISCVIDSGLERMLDYSPASGMNRLNTQSISQDSATQRSGRAGRLSSGVCYRMWTAQQQSRLLKHASAEILHSDLSSLVLELANWGVTKADDMQWMDVPPLGATEQAKTLLQQLSAMDERGNITAHGRNMLKLGTHPRLAHMMLAAIQLNQAYHACLIASILTEKDIFQAHANKSADKSADIHDRIQILVHARANHHGIDSQPCKRILQTADDFFRRVKQCSQTRTTKERLDNSFSGVLLAYAYPDRIAKQRHANQARYLLSNGKGAVIPPYFQQHHHEYLVVANLDANLSANRGEARIYLAADISAEQLQDYFSDNIQHEESVAWNENAQRVEVKETNRIGKIILEESIQHDVKNAATQETIQQCLIQVIRDTGLENLNWGAKTESLKQRVLFMNHHLQNNPTMKKQFSDLPLPDFSQQALSDTLDEWLLPHLSHENSLKQCAKLDLYSLLLNQLSWQQQQLIKQLAPERISVPSGSSVNIDYSDPAQPILAVRLQELFGLYDTPTLLNGQCKLTMHLLSPARKPMQVTQDLNSFWKTTYHDVKKELRGTYKRHYWPDDPFTAQATSKTKKQMNRE